MRPGPAHSEGQNLNCDALTPYDCKADERGDMYTSLTVTHTSPSVDIVLSYWSGREVAAFTTRTEGVSVPHHLTSRGQVNCSGK